ncbi:MAG: PAS domain S-box protein [Desulfamplus sp.]|nr:PAS domain S-box protein [Desulfamplus sp.]
MSDRQSRVKSGASPNGCVEAFNQGSAEKLRLYETIINAVDEPMCFIDSSYRFLMTNRHYEKLLNLSHGEILGKTLPEIWGEKAFDPRAKELIERCLEGESVKFKGFFSSPARGERYMAFNYYPYRGEEDDIRGVLCIAYDLTDTKNTEDALKYSENRYRVMMESMMDPVAICSWDYRIEYMNPAMFEIAGEGDVGDICYRTLHGFDSKCRWCDNGESMEVVPKTIEYVRPINKKNYHVAISPIVNNDGTVSRLTIFRDVTAMKDLEKALHKAQKMEAIATLSGGIAHDFNNILFPISGYTEMLLDMLPDQTPYIDYLQEISKASRRAKELIAQILTFSRRGDEHMEAIGLEPIIKEVMKLIISTLPATIRIKQEIFRECFNVVASPTQIHQVMMNLATNAYHAMEEKGGVLTVNLTNEIVPGEMTPPLPGMAPGEYVLLKVSDTGRGIPLQLQKKILEPYFTTKPKGKGTGLGLSVVAGIVKRCKGFIYIESVPGKGTDISIYFPRADTHQEWKGISRDNSLVKGGYEKILLIDDNPAVLNMEKRLIESLGYKVTAVQESTRALELFKENPDGFDLVLTDLTMPGLTGDRLAKEIFAVRPNMPLIVCTGMHEGVNPGECEIMGMKFQCVLSKPVNKAHLAGAIRSALDNGEGGSR